MTVADPQASQAGLAVALNAQVAPIAAVVAGMSAEQVAAQYPSIAAAVYQQVRRFGAVSATLAVRQYQSDRRRAKAGGLFTPRPAPAAGLDAVNSTVGWATAPLRAGEPDGAAKAQQRLTVGAEKLALDPGRQTIVRNSLNDPKARGWARLTEPTPCAFCAMLATRGPVYKEDTGDFRSHDRCRCHAEPVFAGYEPSAQVRQYAVLYREATAAVHGMKNMQSAFRAAFYQQYQRS